MMTEYIHGPLDGKTTEQFCLEDVGRLIRQKIRMPNRQMAEKLHWDWCGELTRTKHHYYHVYMIEKHNGCLNAIYCGWEAVHPLKGGF